jgi:hypothetical protein
MKKVDASGKNTAGGSATFFGLYEFVSPYLGLAPVVSREGLQALSVQTERDRERTERNLSRSKDLSNQTKEALRTVKH